MKKVLFVATVDSHIELFHLPYLKMFKDKGYEVHVATDSDKPIKYCDKKIKLPIKRSPFSLSNFKAIRELKKIVNSEKYEIVHCHTPMGGVVARLAAKKARKNGTRVIYTAHGFHFYKGAPLKNWLLFYPVEKRLAKFTDTLIVINNEDYELAKKKFCCKDVHRIHGIGVDQNKFIKNLDQKQKAALKKKLGFNNEDFIITYVAELSHRKNQAMAIEAIRILCNREIKNVKLLLIGSDSYDGRYQRMAEELNLNNNVKFLGFRTDVDDIMSVSDLEIATSRQEGLGLHLAEAMLLGVPVIATVDRGHKELIKDGFNGILVPQNDSEKLAEAVQFIITDGKKKKEFVKNSKQHVEKFLLKNVKEEMRGIYSLDNDRPLRILHIFNTMIFGGAESVIMNIYRNIDRDKIQFDFLVHGECVFAEEIRKLGGKVYTLPGYINELGPIKYGAILRGFFKNNKKYKIIHCHLDKTSGFVFANIKKIYNPVCISHAHCCENMENNIAVKIYKKYLKRKLKNNADIKIACSKEAGEWIFDENYAVINNPVDAKKFKVDYSRRKLTRDRLALSDEDFVIGTIGRLEPIKNHMLLITAYKKAFPAANYKNVRLVIVGDGSLKDSISKSILDDKRIRLLEPISEVVEYYNAFDLFVIPSMKEGFSMALLEAYCNGLPIVASDGIPECVMNDIGSKSVNGFDADVWSESLKKAYENKSARTKNVLNSKYDVKNIAQKMERIYYECER